MKLESLTDDGAQSLRTPGLYIEWRAQGLAGRRVLSGGVPVFIGFVKEGTLSGDAPRARWFDRWERFARVFDDSFTSPYLMHAVRGFFENGGARCLIAPVQIDAKHDAVSALVEPLNDGGFLEDIEEIDLVCVPDAVSSQLGESNDAGLAVQAVAMEHCERMGNRFALLDAMPAAKAEAGTAADDTGSRRMRASLEDVVKQWQKLPAQHGALYYPWIDVKPLSGAFARRRFEPTVCVPPCGHIPGVYARCDQREGVFRPPANEVLEGALDLEFDLGDDDQAGLNQAGINCLRERPGWGLRVWGARTLNDLPQMRYVNVTRLLLALRRELDYHLRDLMFEPNSPTLWKAVADRLKGYFSDLYLAGALKGGDESEAYFVKCDAETNPPAERDAGRLNAVAGLAAAAPAEFVVVRITQSADGVSVAGPDMEW